MCSNTLFFFNVSFYNIKAVAFKYIPQFYIDVSALVFSASVGVLRVQATSVSVCRVCLQRDECLTTEL